jgi:hypothetical protein
MLEVLNHLGSEAVLTATTSQRYPQGEGRWGCYAVERRNRKPLGFSLGAYRRQRQWAVRDTLEAARLQRLPPGARAYYERFLREYYAVDARGVREGLHADRLKPEHVRRLPARVRRWWGRQLELWPARAARWAAGALGLKEKDLDTSLRRSLYIDQNRATRDVFSLGRVEYLEEDQGL